MEHHKNSSPDTLISLECEEDLLSEEHQSYSSLDTITIMNCSEKIEQKKHQRQNEHRCRRDQRKSNIDSVKTKLVVEQKNFKCIINLNTTVCNHESNSHRSNNESSPKERRCKNSNERIVPRCLRQLCHKQHRHRRHPKKQCKTGSHHQTRVLNGTQKKLHTANHVHKKSRHSRHQKKPNNEKLCQKEIQNKINAEPKILTPTKQLDLEYEDISNKSLDSYLEIPTSYKHVKLCNEHYESRLDTLIKRTKERERKLVEQSRKVTPRSGTPYTEVSSAEFPMTFSENASLHSRSTLVLEPLDHRYSPSIEGYTSTETEYYLPNEDYFLGYSDSSFEYNIKSEQMDIEAYSPTQSYELKIKSEQADLDAYSPTQSPKSAFDETGVKREIK